MELPDGRGRTDMVEPQLRGFKLDSRLLPDRLAADLANACQGLTGADMTFS
jgi:hypothetical protein